MKIWIVTVTAESDSSSWVDTVFETYEHARRRADHITRHSPGFHARTEPFIIIPERTKPLK